MTDDILDAGPLSRPSQPVACWPTTRRWASSSVSTAACSELNMLLAVLEKRAGFRLGTKDVFLNVTGGISVDDPAIDLAVIASILSSNEDIAVGKDVCFAGEVGLSGEIRPVNRVEQRIQEAEKLGFATIFVSKYNKISTKFPGIKVVLVSKIEEIVEHLFG